MLEHNKTFKLDFVLHAKHHGSSKKKQQQQKTHHILMIWDEIMKLKRMVQKVRLKRKTFLPLTYDFWVKPFLKTTSFEILMAKE